MKIAEVTAYIVRYPEPNDNGSLRHLTFCRVRADDGTCGWGEAITQFESPAAATAQLIRDLTDQLVGHDPMENVAIWRDLKRTTWWYGYRGGITSFAIAAIDVALWDLKGKLLGQPLVNLLGGAIRPALPVVASTHAFHASLTEEAERHGRYVREQGYQGVKVGMGKAGQAHLGYEIERDVSFMRQLREAVGPQAMIMMDRGQSLPWTVADAIRRTAAFEEYDLTWIEEPLEPYDISGFLRLRQQVSSLVASGEREWTADGFRTFMDTGVADVIGCDVGRAEGITGVLKVIEQVEAHQLWFNSHAWSSAVNTAASLALSAITPRCLVQELKPDPNPMQNELVKEPFVPRDGLIAVPQAPGLGVEVDETALGRYLL